MTKLAKTLLSIVIIILLIIVGIYSSNKNKTAEVVPGVPVVSEATSIKGCYVARLAQDVYVLNIDSQDKNVVSGVLAYNNYQKDSSSGTFTGTFVDGILLGIYSFDSEGMRSNSQLVFKKEGNNFIQGFGESKMSGNQSVFVDLSTVTYDPKSTFVKSDDCTDTFKDANNTFSFDYNSFFKVNSGESKVLTTNWIVNNGESKGVILANAYIQKAYMPQTNFSDVRFTVGRSTEAGAIKNCLLSTQGSKPASPTKVTINGYPFTKFISGDAGAGNYYETTSYRGVVDGDCYAIEYTIHSTSIDAYSPDQGIKQFDKAKVVNEVEKIVKSFKFIISSN